MLVAHPVRTAASPNATRLGRCIGRSAKSVSKSTLITVGTGRNRSCFLPVEAGEVHLGEAQQRERCCCRLQPRPLVVPRVALAACPAVAHYEVTVALLLRVREGIRQAGDSGV